MLKGFFAQDNLILCIIFDLCQTKKKEKELKKKQQKSIFKTR